MNKIVILSVVMGFVVAACGSSSVKTNAPEAEAVGDGGVACVPSACPLPVKAESKCPGDMVLVSGNYCPKIREGACIEHKGPKWAPCSKYAPATCESKTVHKEYCIDRDEEHNASGIPLGDETFSQCKAVCASQGKRLCKEDEWTFACEGEGMLAFSYSNEYNPDECNVNRKYKELVCGPNQPGRKVRSDLLCDLRANISEYQGCVSPFGAHNMIGDVDEWVQTAPYYKAPHVTFDSGMKGGHFGAGRHRCRPTTYGHGAGYSQISSGCRCCED